MSVVNFNRDMVIRNVESLPGGLGARFLLVINGENGEYVAKGWKRKAPAKMEKYETLIDFKK